MTAKILVLPAELYLLTFSFLPANHVWRLRRVCKAWQAILSSKPAEVMACNTHNSHDPADSIAFDDQERRKALVRAHHQGRPAGLLRKIPFDFDIEIGVTPAFKGNRLAVVETRPKIVTLFDLSTGAPSRHSADEDIKHLCLTSRLLAYTDSDKLYVGPHHEEIIESSPIQGKVLSIAGDDETIVMRLELEEKESLVVRDGKTWPIPSETFFKYETKMHAMLLLGQKCYLFTYVYGSDEEEVEIDFMCRNMEAGHVKHKMHIIVLDIETGETSLTTREYNPTLNVDDANDLQERFTVYPTGRRDEYHLGIRPAGSWSIEHDLLLDLGTLTFKQFSRQEIMAVWKGMIYSCGQESAFGYAGLNAWVTIDCMEPKHKSYLLTKHEQYMNEEMVARIFVNESLLVFADYGWDLTVYTFDEGLTSDKLPVLDSIDVAEASEDLDGSVWVNGAVLVEGEEEEEDDDDAEEDDGEEEGMDSKSE